MLYLHRSMLPTILQKFYLGFNSFCHFERSFRIMIFSLSSEFSSQVWLRSSLFRKSIEHSVERTPQKVATITVLPRTCTEHRNITWHIYKRLSLVTNTWMPLPNLRRSEIDYKLSIVYAWYPDSPTIPVALHELKTVRLVLPLSSFLPS